MSRRRRRMARPTATPTAMAMGEVRQDRQNQRQQQQDPVRHPLRHVAAPFVRLGHIPGGQDEQRGERRQREMPGKRRGRQHDHQHGKRMDKPRDRRLGARAHVLRGARDRARRGEAAKQVRADIGGALGDDLRIWPVAAADHAVGDHGRQQRFDGGQEGNDDRARQKIDHARERNLGKRRRRQGLWQGAVAGDDGVDGQRDRGDERRNRRHDDNCAGKARRHPAQQHNRDQRHQADKQRRQARPYPARPIARRPAQESPPEARPPGCRRNPSAGSWR